VPVQAGLLAQFGHPGHDIGGSVSRKPGTHLARSDCGPEWPVDASFPSLRRVPQQREPLIPRKLLDGPQEDRIALDSCGAELGQASSLLEL
jgi:hypothetical protein